MTHLEHAGHQRLGDGSVLRLDFECRQWCASWYRPGPDHLLLHAYSYGTLDAMKLLVASWADAYEASLSSSPVGGGGRPGAVLTPAPGQTNSLGNVKEAS